MLGSRRASTARAAAAVAPQLVPRDCAVTGGSLVVERARLTVGMARASAAMTERVHVHDYLKPTSADVPAIEGDRLEHPSPFTPLGAKGVGEGGAIPGPAAVANAVEDALAPFGAVIRSLPITPERVCLMRPTETHT